MRLLVTTASGDAESAPSSEHSLPHEALRHVDSLHGFAYQLSKSPGGAEDLVQEAFARALAAKEQFEAGTRLRRLFPRSQSRRLRVQAQAAPHHLARLSSRRADRNLEVAEALGAVCSTGAMAGDSGHHLHRPGG